ncbi:hypothetical protein F4777DRAFT_510377 [Nemania sp. FL0916]|nr:hypothetical protein F4777DRAFT_510377 [Nemania sp. FL0916]
MDRSESQFAKTPSDRPAAHYARRMLCIRALGGVGVLTSALIGCSARLWHAIKYMNARATTNRAGYQIYECVFVCVRGYVSNALMDEEASPFLLSRPPHKVRGLKMPVFILGLPMIIAIMKMPSYNESFEIRTYAPTHRCQCTATAKARGKKRPNVEGHILGYIR